MKHSARFPNVCHARIGVRCQPSVVARLLISIALMTSFFANSVFAGSTDSADVTPVPAHSPQPTNVYASGPDPYTADSSFNAGEIAVDAFAGNINNSYVGRKVVQLPNGDVIVAGMVPQFGTSTGLVNLGMVRYNAAGVRQAWADPGSYGFNGNQYIVYPNTPSPTGANVINVLDLQVFGDRLFVLVDRAFSAADIDSRVIVFTTDGQFLGITSAFGGNDAEYSGGIVIWDNQNFPPVVSIAVAGTTYQSGIARPSFRKGTVNADGSISFDAIVFPNPGNYCPTNRGCELHGISAGGRAGTTPPRLYLAGSRQQDLGGPNWDFLVMQVNSSGSPGNAFAGNGVTTIPFDVGGDHYDRANSIVVTPGFLTFSTDALYLVGLVRFACTDGIGIAKLKQDGSADTAFGDLATFPVGTRTGKTVIGGSVEVSPCSTSPAAQYANAATLSSDVSKLGIAGFSVGAPTCSTTPCPEPQVDASLHVLDVATAGITAASRITYTVPPSVVRDRHVGFWGIYAGTANSFAAVGDVRYFQTAPGQSAGAQQFATLRLRPDRLFANGYE